MCFCCSRLQRAWHRPLRRSPFIFRYNNDAFQVVLFSQLHIETRNKAFYYAYRYCKLLCGYYQLGQQYPVVTHLHYTCLHAPYR